MESHYTLLVLGNRWNYLDDHSIFDDVLEVGVMPYKYVVVWWVKSKTGWAHKIGEKEPPWPRYAEVKCFTNLKSAKKFQQEWSKKDRPGLYILQKPKRRVSVWKW
jgi:hypothetical protein